MKIGSYNYPIIFIGIALALLFAGSYTLYNTDYVQMKLAGLEAQSYSIELSDGSFTTTSETPNDNLYQLAKDGKYHLRESKPDDESKTTYRVNNNGIVTNTTVQPGAEYSLVDGIYVQKKQASSETTLSTIEIVSPKETQEWTNADGSNIAEQQTIGSVSLNLDSAPAQIRGAFSWASLKAAKDNFIKSFSADQKEGNFGDYLKRTSSLWGGDDVLSWSNSDGYVAYLIKYSNTEFFLWEIKPNYQTGDFPTDKNDLEKVQYAQTETKTIANQEVITSGDTNQQDETDTGSKKPPTYTPTGWP